MVWRLKTHREKKEISFTIHKNQLRVDYRLKSKAWNVKLEENKGKMPYDNGLGNDLVDMTPNA